MALPQPRMKEGGLKNTMHDRYGGTMTQVSVLPLMPQEYRLSGHGGRFSRTRQTHNDFMIVQPFFYRNQATVFQKK